MMLITAESEGVEGVLRAGSSIGLSRCWFESPRWRKEPATRAAVSSMTILTNLTARILPPVDREGAAAGVLLWVGHMPVTMALLVYGVLGEVLWLSIAGANHCFRKHLFAMFKVHGYLETS